MSEEVKKIGNYDIKIVNGKTYARLTKGVKVGKFTLNKWVEVKPGESLAKN